jgi:hypothetical protein
LIRVQCPKCGHSQDVGNAWEPKDNCECCGAPLFRVGAMVWTVVAIVVFVAMIVLKMPMALIIADGIVVAITVTWAVVEKTRTKVKRCEDCGRLMTVVGSGKRGGMLLTQQEVRQRIGVAEKCVQCGRVYCDRCYPNRPSNSCTCGRGRDAIEQVDNVIYHGSMRLVKVRYCG